MENRNAGLYGALLVLSGVFAVAAVVTLIPNPGARWANVLGYKSLCTFTPIGTAVCALLAGATCVVRARVFGPGAAKRRSLAVPIAAAIILVAVIGFSLPPYIASKADATSGASQNVQR